MKHLVFSWKRVCSAGGLIALLGGAKRRMLSLAERLALALLPLEPFVAAGAMVTDLYG